MRRSRTTVVFILAALICSTLGTALAAVVQRRDDKPTEAGPAAAPQGITDLVELPTPPSGLLVGIATFDRRTPPTDAVTSALEGLGLVVQPMRRLPVALVYGTATQLRSAVTKRIAADVYPNVKLRYFSAASTKAIAAGPIPDLGVTGKGVGVAVVDTGIDAGHPDLADHVTHNVKMIGPEYLGLVGLDTSPDTPPGTLVVPFDQPLLNNSDTGGHGTHVAGIIGADATTSPSQVGVAPDANLIAYGAGDSLFVFSVLAAFDDILVKQKALGIRVVNNSWGDSSGAFDPKHPINQATKALYDAGIVTVFAAGNDGEAFTMNPYSLAPWVISVGSTTVGRQRSAFTSGGLEYDNSEAVAVPADKHLRFEGDRVGLYHPDVSAPGTDIESSGTPLALGTLSPSLPGGTAVLSGTSMAAPHIAGLAALLFEARPSLTPDQVRQVLQVTAGDLDKETVFWRSGFGMADAARALELVRRGDFSQDLLNQLEREAEEAILAARPFRVRSSDFYSYTPALVTAAGSDRRSYSVDVADVTRAVTAAVSYPSTNVAGVNKFDYRITIKDAAGKVVASSIPSDTAGVSRLFADLGSVAGGVKFGRWTVEVAGQLGVSDPGIVLGNTVSLAVAQLEAQVRPAAGTETTFVAEGAKELFFSPAGPAGLLGGLDGCEPQDPPTKGGLTTEQPTAPCRSAAVGYPITSVLDVPAEFTSAPLADAATAVGGPARLTLYLADPAAPLYSGTLAALIDYDLALVGADGKVTSVTKGRLDKDAVVDSAAKRGEYLLQVPPTAVPAGSRLRLQLRFNGAYASAMRMYYGKGYADAGLAVTLGRIVPTPQA